MLHPSLTPEARSLLELARQDPQAAGAQVARLSFDEQVALVCEAPVRRRAELLLLTPQPEAVIPRLPEADFCFTVKAVGLADAPWILEHASGEQLQAAVDLDVWQGDLPDRATLDQWLDALIQTPPTSLMRAVEALDLELLTLCLRSRIAVEMKPSEQENPDWQAPAGSQTLDGVFHLTGLREGDDLEGVTTLLQTLFENAYWTYFRLLQALIWELDPENEEWALRWRNGRLQDLGFPVWDEAMSIYAYIAPVERGRLPAEARALDVSEWRLPVWIPDLPISAESGPPLFRAIANLGPEERRGAFFALVGLSNKVAVADRMPLSDSESTPLALEKAVRFASEGLLHVVAETEQSPTTVLRHVPLQRLFSIGANLDPEAAKPALQPSDVAREADEVLPPS